MAQEFFGSTWTQRRLSAALQKFPGAKMQGSPRLSPREPSRALGRTANPGVAVANSIVLQAITPTMLAPTELMATSMMATGRGFSGLAVDPSRATARPEQDCRRWPWGCLSPRPPVLRSIEGRPAAVLPEPVCSRGVVGRSQGCGPSYAEVLANVMGPFVAWIR